MIHPIEVFEAYKLLKNQWKSPEEIKRIQDNKLGRLIKHAYEKVPYYRQLFDSLKLNPDDIRSTEDLKKIPMTSKETIKSLPLNEIIAQGFDIKTCRIGFTAGSTATPLKVYYNWQDARLIGIALVRNFLAFGLKPWYKVATFFMYFRNAKRRSPLERIGIWRSWKLSPWEEPELLLQKLKTWNPQVIYGYFMTLKLLAETIKKKGIKGITAQIVISSAGILDTETRKLISSAFNAEVFDYYGSWEGGNIAWECPQCSGYHINSDMVIVELLKDSKQAAPGQEGEIVLTNLNSYAMPFIRYRQEDIAVLSNKPTICGRPFPLIQNIVGRWIDFTTLPSGKKVSPLPIMAIMVKDKQIDQFRIIQEKIDLLTIEIVPSRNFNQSHSDKIKSELKQILGQGMKIAISLVEKIKFPPLTKRRLIYSKVSDIRAKEANSTGEQ